jgi:hypothetical protein
MHPHCLQHQQQLWVVVAMMMMMMMMRRMMSKMMSMQLSVRLWPWQRLVLGKRQHQLRLQKDHTVCLGMATELHRFYQKLFLLLLRLDG